ncbi:hypothetical protein V6259_13005 [Marinomonas sp. TI.3.20]|uniref:hypothetical protein n=1 Tax=Marinomonas sp. TI.3.20 TaxID=3121296 RepID=UPI00311DE7F3
MVTKQVRAVASIIRDMEEIHGRVPTYDEILDEVYARRGETASCSASTVRKAKIYLEQTEMYPDINNSRAMAKIGRAAISQYLDEIKFGQMGAVLVTHKAVQGELYRGILQETLQDLESLQVCEEGKIKAALEALEIKIRSVLLEGDQGDKRHD